jgi:hypothetical protein
MMAFSPTLFAQDEDEDYYKNLLEKTVEVENPVYKPVISLSAGILHFLGDIRNPGNNPLQGDLGYRLNIATWAGKNNYYKLNFFFMYGLVKGHDFNISRAMQSDPTKLTLDPNTFLPIYHNSSFFTEFFEFGGSFEYSFGHWLGNTKKFKPFVSLGLSPLIISRYLTNESDANGNYYFCWSDGTIRDAAEQSANAWQANIINFDNTYNRNINQANYHDQPRIKQPNLVIPVEVGFDLFLSYRVNFRIATSLHYTLTDMLDNYNSKVASKYGLTSNKVHDMFMFTNISLNLDLFSDPKYKVVESFFADYSDNIDYDVMFADQDLDGVWDRLDECPDTPLRVPVDSLGCPFDTDGDGIPDYMDDDLNTPRGSIVDEKGVPVSPEVLAQMFESSTAVRREDARMMPIAPIWTRSISFTPGVIPEKFKRVDTDGDGYVSFSELLSAIEKFFDGSLEVSVEEIYELNNYFFSQ